MSCNSGELISCPNIQEGLDRQFEGLNGVFTGTGTPLVEFLSSPLNTEGTLQRQIDAGNGHYRTVELRYQSRILESAVSTSTALSCSGGSQPCNDSQVYTVPSAGSSYKWAQTLTALEAQCEDDESFFARQVSMAIDAVKRKMETTSWAQAVALVGKFASTGTTTPIVVQTKNLTTKQYIPDAVEAVRYQMFQNEYYGDVFAFGGGQTFYDYFSSVLGSVPNTYLGIDLVKMFGGKGIMPFMSYRSAAAFGNTSDFLTVGKGALQLITFNEYRGANGIRVIDEPTTKYGVIQDPATGLNFDYFANLDCGTWNFMVKLAHKLVALPNDLFQSGDRLDGVNWINQFRITNS